MNRAWIIKFLFFLAFATILLLPQHPAQADGIILPDPCEDCPPPPCREPGRCPISSVLVQLAIRYHHVTVTIIDQVAVTHVDQVFYNPNDWAVEGTYLFPLPADAAVTGFSLWVDGEPLEGQVLEAQEARQMYQQIVSSLRDPALLEYAGRGVVQAQIFPIPPKGERRVELEYTQVLAAEEGLVRYIYPLSTEKFSTEALEQVSVSVTIHAGASIRAVYSPSHAIDVQRRGELDVDASYEAADVLPDADFALYYSLGETEAFHLVSARDATDPSDPDGFFLLLLAPRPEAEAAPLPKDLILVLDHSGSMEGEKFTQAQAAARYILAHLNPEDRFNLVTFSSGVETYSRRLAPAAEAPEATAWIDRLSAVGSTDIQRALAEAAALAGSERPTYLIFLTDGLPTVGVIDSEAILADFERSATQNLRLFSFGVGYDVDTFLLDSLAQDHHGASFYVQPGERLDESLSTFYARISTPLLTDLALDFGDLSVYDLYPMPLPDLFRGGQIVVVGRYRQPGGGEIRLSGWLEENEMTYRFPDQALVERSTPGDPLAALLPRLWATRKIGYLLNQVRLNGADSETVDQIVRLSIRYGIVTPYTSYLVTEELPLGEEAQEELIERESQALSAPQAASGAEAVQKAADQGAMQAAEAPAVQSREILSQVRMVGGRTFALQDGTWIDTGFDPQSMQVTPVVFLSADYFALAQLHPDLAAAFALGEQVIALSGGKAYSVVSEAGQQLEKSPTLAVGEPTVTNPEAATPADAVPVMQEPQPAEPSEKSGSWLPCLGGLLPSAIVCAGWFATRKDRRLRL